jgi:hypothetical protein
VLHRAPLIPRLRLLLGLQAAQGQLPPGAQPRLLPQGWRPVRRRPRLLLWLALLLPSGQVQARNQAPGKARRAVHACQPRQLPQGVL